mmetsp:Transcript_35426/g.89682  ORF Transcript_35426/g.89682 Transcript_35426/m.89682 type:complete len:333 (-) Transcript_35426:134-1132(-)
MLDGRCRQLCTLSMPGAPHLSANHRTLRYSLALATCPGSRLLANASPAAAQPPASTRWKNAVAAAATSPGASCSPKCDRRGNSCSAPDASSPTCSRPRRGRRLCTPLAAPPTAHTTGQVMRALSNAAGGSMARYTAASCSGAQHSSHPPPGAARVPCAMYWPNTAGAHALNGNLLAKLAAAASRDSNRPLRLSAIASSCTPGEGRPCSRSQARMRALDAVVNAGGSYTYSALKVPGWLPSTSSPSAAPSDWPSTKHPLMPSRSTAAYTASVMAVALKGSGPAHAGDAPWPGRSSAMQWKCLLSTSSTMGLKTFPCRLLAWSSSSTGPVPPKS